MEYIFPIMFFYIFIIKFNLSIERNKTHIYSNNIIKLSQYNLRYINFANNSDGDMIFYSTAFGSTTDRVFYGFKKNGRPFFQNESNYFLLINANKSLEQNKYESKTIFIKPFYNCQKEYLMSVGKIYSYVEIYDFDNNNKIYEKRINDFSSSNAVESYRNEAIFLESNNTGNYYLFGFTINENIKKFSFQIHKFNITLDKFKKENTTIIIDLIDNAYYHKLGVSCFKTEQRKIMCFYLTNDNKYNIIVYDFNLNKNANYSTEKNIHEGANPFYKCIHLKKEIGVFSYYKNDIVPIFLFKKYENKNKTIINYNFGEIILNNTYKFINSILRNDIIKLEENKICFSSTENEKKKIYITLINLFENDTKYKIRYYLLNINEIHNIFFHLDISVHSYNNLIALGFSYCEQSNCEARNEHKSALMILNYPNRTDKSFDLFNHSIYNPNSTINDYSINLENEVRIDNNLFGYKFSSIIIKNILNCDNPKFMSYLKGDDIFQNYYLQKNERVKMKFELNENDEYEPFKCILQYYYKVKEPELNEYDIFPELIEGSNETDYIEREYQGKLTIYNISFNEKLTSSCSNYICDLCVKNNIINCPVEEYLLNNLFKNIPLFCMEYNFPYKIIFNN